MFTPIILGTFHSCTLSTAQAARSKENVFCGLKSDLSPSADYHVLAYLKSRLLPYKAVIGHAYAHYPGRHFKEEASLSELPAEEKEAERPKCALCKKIGAVCEYSKFQDGSGNEYRNLDTVLPLAAAQIDNQAIHNLTPSTTPGFSFSGAQIPFGDMAAERDSFSQNKNGQINGDNLASHESLIEFELPSHDLLLELTTLFFDNLYHMFPCFHKLSFFSQLQTGKLQEESPLVLFAMCCVAARYHPDIAVKKRSQKWYEQAKFYYDVTHRHPNPAVRTMQAALLLILHAFTAGDFSTNWLFIGKTWRQAVALGLNSIDFTNKPRFNTGKMCVGMSGERYYAIESRKVQTAIELEECRRTLWLMFIMDRNHAWPTGWAFAISEKHVKVDIPVADELFQDMDNDVIVSPHENIPFTTNLDRLINSLSTFKEPLNIFSYIVAANVLLGRVSELIHSLHDSPDTPEYDKECAKLDSCLVKLKLSVPRQGTSLFDAADEDRPHVVWLQVVFNIIDMLLHYNQSFSDSPSVEASSQLPLAIAAARRTAQLVKDASRISVEILLSPHIGSSLYVAASILVIEWRLTGDPELKQDLDLFVLVFDRMDDIFVFLGLKFKLALEHDMKRTPEAIKELKERGFRGLLADCSKWTYVKEEVSRRGVMVEIS